MINKDSELDVIPGIAYRNGAVGTGLFCLIYVVISFILQYVLRIKIWISSTQLLWLGGSVIGIFLIFRNLTLYIATKDRKALTWTLIGIIAFVLSLIVFSLGIIPDTEV